MLVVVGGEVVPLTAAQIHARRALAVRLLEWACEHPGAETEQSPRYVQVTEGRDQGPGYSSCADLAHWLYFCLGIRAKWVNRAEHLGFKTQVNVWRLVQQAVRFTKADPARVEGGDVLVISNQWGPTPEHPEWQGADSHVVCVRSSLQEDNTYQTAEYGLPAGGFRERELHGRVLGHKRVQVWLPLDRILQAAHAVGKLTDASGPEECFYEVTHT